MKKMKIIVAVIIFLLIVYFIIKGAFLYTYNNSIVEDDTYLVSLKESFNNNEQMNVSAINLESDEYYTFNDINFRKPNLEEKTSSNTVDFFENDNVAISIKISDFNLVDQVKNDNFYFLNNLLEDKKITTDYELLKFIVNNYNKDLNILSSIKSLREATEINTETKIIMNTSTNIIKISGSLNGYIMGMNNNIIYAILNNNDIYYNITFYEYNLTQVNEFLNTVKFTN